MDECLYIMNTNYKKGYDDGKEDVIEEVRDMMTFHQDSPITTRIDISHKLIILDVEEIENVLNIRNDGKYCKFTDKYLITVTRR